MSEITEHDLPREAVLWDEARWEQFIFRSNGDRRYHVESDVLRFCGIRLLTGRQGHNNGWTDGETHYFYVAPDGDMYELHGNAYQFAYTHCIGDEQVSFLRWCVAKRYGLPAGPNVKTKPLSHDEHRHYVGLRLRLRELSPSSQEHTDVEKQMIECFKYEGDGRWPYSTP